MGGTKQWWAKLGRYAPAAGVLLFFVIVIISLVSILRYLVLTITFHRRTAYPVVVTSTDTGSIAVVDKERHVNIHIPSSFSVQPKTGVMDFYTEERDCRLTVEAIPLSPSVSLEEWIAGDKEQLSALTVLTRQVSFLNAEKTRAVYTLDTVETGLTYVYYDWREELMTAVRIFSPAHNHRCYSELENLVLNNNT